MKVRLDWKEHMQFEGDNLKGAPKVKIDSSDPRWGGEGNGVAAKEAFLIGIAACTAMDVVAISKKMRFYDKIEDFNVTLDGTLSEGGHPKVFVSFDMVYELKGDIPEKKLKRAVDLSQSTYCALSIMMKRIADFSYKIVLNGNVIEEKSTKKSCDD